MLRELTAINDQSILLARSRQGVRGDGSGLTCVSLPSDLDVNLIILIIAITTIITISIYVINNIISFINIFGFTNIIILAFLHSSEAL